MRPGCPIWGGHLVFVVVAADQLTEIMKHLFAFFVFVYNICICICICIYNWCGQKEKIWYTSQDEVVLIWLLKLKLKKVWETDKLQPTACHQHFHGCIGFCCYIKTRSSSFCLIAVISIGVVSLCILLWSMAKVAEKLRPCHRWSDPPIIITIPIFILILIIIIGALVLYCIALNLSYIKTGYSTQFRNQLNTFSSRHCFWNRGQETFTKMLPLRDLEAVSPILTASGAELLRILRACELLEISNLAKILWFFSLKAYKNK